MSVFIDRTQVASDKAPVLLWANRFQSGTLSASSEAAGFDKENAIDDNTYDFWKPASLPATITNQTGIPWNLNCFAIAAHNLGSTGCTISFERFVGGSYVEVASYTPTDDSTIMVLFDQVGSSNFRFYITGSSAPSIGVISVGLALKIESGILPAYTPITYGESVELLKSQTMSGQFITNRVNRRGASTDVQFNILDREFVEATGANTFQDFRTHYNDGKPFFFASNPVELDFDCAYCWRQGGGEIRPTFEQNGIFYQTALSLEAYIG